MIMSNNISPESGNDAIFLSSMYREDKNSIHGCENELYIIYYNGDSNNGHGSFEIEIISSNVVNNLLNDVGDDHIKFFDYLPQYFESKWEYADRDTELFQEIYSIYNEADFIVSRDGSLKDEFDFIKNWCLNITY